MGWTTVFGIFRIPGWNGGGTCWVGVHEGANEVGVVPAGLVFMRERMRWGWYLLGWCS